MSAEFEPAIIIICYDFLIPSLSFLIHIGMTTTRRKQAPLRPSTSAVDEDDRDPSEEYLDEEDDSKSDGGYSDEPVTKRRKTAKGKSVATEAGSSSKAKGKRAVTSKKAPAKGKARSRGTAGSLEGMLKMPMDMIYEILCHSTPCYLILLARTNKMFRDVLMSRQSSFIWIAARQNVSGTPAPDPPSDMAEPAWANLLYTPDEACFECDKSTKYIDFAFRRRLCLGCRKQHLLRIKSYQSSSGRGYDTEVFDLVPYTKTGGYFGGWSDGGRGRSYWIPDLQAMQVKFTQLQQNIKVGGPTARSEYDNFVQTRSLEVQTILSPVKAFESWVAEKEREEYAIIAAKKDDRFNDIVNRLVAAGYSREEVLNNQRFRSQKGLQGVRPINDAAYKKLEPNFREPLDAERTRKAKLHRRDQIVDAYTLFLQSLVPIQRFFIPHELFPSRNSPRVPRMPKLPSVEQLLNDNASTEVSQEELVTLTTSLYADTSTWALERMKGIAQAASLAISLPPSVAWVTLDTPAVERERRLAELGKIFDLAAAVFVVDTWKSGTSNDRMDYDYVWNCTWPSLGPAPALSGGKTVFIGRDAMNMGSPDNMNARERYMSAFSASEVMVFSMRGAEAVGAVLALEHLDPASATTTELDARNSLFKCTHCSATEQDFVYTWRGCVVHFLNKEEHPQPSWSIVPAAEATLYTPDGGSFLHRLDGFRYWMCNHCAAASDDNTMRTYTHVFQHVSAAHAIESPQEDSNLFYLPRPEECAPRLLSMSRTA
ncbi:hypothetical protein DFH09DRAFT_645780 [Mycena vulgaris]|nr:hypothetical protein DFH09DRAFT_645780 [Mycena vulgaris]